MGPPLIQGDIMKALRLALLIGLVVLGPACSTTRAYTDGPAPYGPHYVAFDEGFRHGLTDGKWAGYRDLDKSYRQGFWGDERYRRGGEGYRPRYGSKTEYADGYRVGYERGYLERREAGRRDYRR